MAKIVSMALGAGLLLAAGLAAPAEAAAPQPAACAALAGARIAPDFEVVSAKAVAADAAAGLPAHCEVQGVARPVAGSRIGVVYRLPATWNGKAVGLGGGGWAGNVRAAAAAPALAKGYAVFQTDGGHESAEGTNLDWALTGRGQFNDPGMADFAWRAVHEMTVKGKQVAARFYGRTPERAYFQGCSTGGRQGLMEAQRFPGDYDGIIAGAPVYDLLVQTSAVYRTQIFHADPASNLKPAQLEALNRAALSACDGLDGQTDGIVTNPSACRWDPAALGCDRAQSATCLTPKQVAAVRRAYAGLKTEDGRVVAWPLPRGGELDWLGRSLGDERNPLGSNAATGARAIQYFSYADPDYDILTWDPETGLAQVRDAPYASVYEAGDPVLAAFVEGGGKLLLWHGEYDPGPSALATTQYFERVRQATPGADGAVAFFLAPGVYHCGGGPGADRFDTLEAMDRWVETGAAPSRIEASNPRTGESRPLCPYPATAVLTPGADPRRGESYACRARPSA